MQVTNSPPAAGGGAADNADWVRVDVTDGWNLNDPDSTLSAVSNTGGTNSATINTTANTSVVDSAVYHKEILNNDGSSIDYSTRPVSIEFYVAWPSSSWSVNSGSTVGGDGKPTTASKCYVVAGIMADPENLPATAGAAEHPLDLLGVGLRSNTSTHKHDRFSVYNVGTGSPRGTITTNNQNMPTISSGEYGEGKKFVNRLTWWTRIAKHDAASGTGINVVGEPLANEYSWSYFFDNGTKKVGDLEVIVDQRFGRVSTTGLHAFVALGRMGGAGADVTVDFDIFYRITALDGGNHPNGTTGLSA
jgi:hypothetical protein